MRESTPSSAMSDTIGICHDQFYGNRWLMFPPGHDNLDHRVNRTIGAIQSAGHDLTVYYEADRLVSSGSEKHFDHAAKVEKMPVISWGYFKAVLDAIRRAKTQDDRLTVYVHDSGFIGLIICTLASLVKRRGDRIIMDYHDSLEWELFYQSGKFFRNRRLRSILVAMVRYFFKLVLSFFIRIDVIIGISEGQVVQLKDRFGISAKNTLAAPNTRHRLEGNFHREGPEAILWVGNVSKGRRFEDTYKLREKLAAKPIDLPAKIAVVGKRLNQGADAVVDEDLVIELGGFKTDADIAKLTSDWKTVGVFFGWDDPQGSGINAISSVNKIFSYINTLTPFLIAANQTNMIESLNIPREFIFDDLDNMAARFNWISLNYSTAVSLVTRLKASTPWDSDVVSMLESEFAR